ncbi:MAG: cobalamin-independent methionine synthase II family protein [Rhodospirillales bacterium]|jgi:5-methyltetrahydropteroyltriglutamate--homocysteine methyltransferase|nr:epoxyalkane--coenzyme M transferase [Rhodospirillaceae bacterium]MDP6427307.1 cobalamin-independent methionine synthase II family protein [Rhodospirillales bacterium]MDP6645087.1 cobalamin-independent methionine synthase II family protein [Rhodospirillales bacterium]MDP6841603.1 cobalamin-independent methionine synthase II family protein [Rhodospirillales bacterium]|tara:strand:- start:2802 stop:3986 length:1185 start_codon:yes stop_codon:yes gene_type:complete
MKRSEDRILTTHVGSLIRPQEIKDHLLARPTDGYDEAAHRQSLTRTVAEIVRRQADAGIDVVSDGEFGKGISWSQYMLERLSGFERRFLDENASDPYAAGEDRKRFADFYREMDAADARSARGDGGAVKAESICTGPITYTGQAELQRDIDNIKAATEGVDVIEAFLPVAAPASAIPDRRNEYYATNEECVFALADAMRIEYKTITDNGLLVQIDDARAAVTYDRMVPPASKEDFLSWLAMHMEALNHAIKGIPEESIRYHVCWGSWPGPHTTDVPLRDIVDLVLSVNAGAYVIEGANPRHEHEWRVWEDIELPEGKVLIPGVISHATNIVEHPELVAERVTRLAKLVGRENVIASTDCGFAQGPFHKRVHETVMWAKLEALAEGARRASEKLW